MTEVLMWHSKKPRRLRLRGFSIPFWVGGLIPRLATSYSSWKPVRIELYSDELGYLDIHPFVLNEDGTSKQADLEGGWYEFEKDYFGSVFFEGKTIPCISLKGQKVFHSGYELRDKDKHDISILESLSK